MHKFELSIDDNVKRILEKNFGYKRWLENLAIDCFKTKHNEDKSKYNSKEMKDFILSPSREKADFESDSEMIENIPELAAKEVDKLFIDWSKNTEKEFPKFRAKKSPVQSISIPDTDITITNHILNYKKFELCNGICSTPDSDQNYDIIKNVRFTKEHKRYFITFE